MRAHPPVAFALVLCAACSAGAPPTVIASSVMVRPHSVARAASDSTTPWTLTASDGSGLELVRVDARAVVRGPLAFTEVHLHFHNPEDRTREGTFQITLP